MTVLPLPPDRDLESDISQDDLFDLANLDNNKRCDQCIRHQVTLR
jgi:hypothetical protein